MPRSYGNNHLHISQVDAVVENTLPLFCLPDIPVTKEDEAIGRYIVEEIPDRACIQLGIGGIPNAVARFLSDKTDLSVHTEMLCDSLMELYYQGVITSRHKTYMPDKWVGTFVFGSQKLYDFVDENPLIYMCGTELVNNPNVACCNDNLIAINTTLEVDLSGQCASESIAYRQYTGIGGQLDFVHASAMSKGGKSFICTYSTYTDKEGKLHSKIIPALEGHARRPSIHIRRAAPR
jgi:acyl-CoA hydrolase